MMKRILYTGLGCVVLSMTLVSCKLGRAYVRPEMELPNLKAQLEANRIDSTSSDSASLADLKWWEIYGDTVLQGLIRKTLDQNKDMKTALAKVKELAALKRVDVSKLFPQIDGRIYAEKDAKNYGGDQYKSSSKEMVRFLLSWELDLWGNARWGMEKSKAQLLGAMDNMQAMQVSLVAQMAQSYFELVALDHRLKIVKQTLRARTEGVRLAKIRFEGGLTSETSYQQARVELARTVTLVPDLERSISEKENEIALLTGSFPYQIPRTELDEQTIAHLLEREIPVGLSSALLERRPDVRAAEKALIAANAEVGIAFTNLFPRLTLTAQFGAESKDLKQFFQSPAHFLSADLLAPIFAMGRNRAQLKAKKAAYEQQVYQYEKQVIVAFKEVRNALVGFNKSQEVFVAKQKLEEASYTSNQLANLQYLNGYIGYLDVLDAQRSYFDAQLSLSDAVLAKQLALVQLYKALGGGW